MTQQIKHTNNRGGFHTNVNDSPSLTRFFSHKEQTFFWVFFILFFVSLLFFVNTINSSLLIEVPRSGGSFTEGVIGRPAFINPTLAISNTDRDLSHLVYAGLLRSTPEGDFVPDLADEYIVSADGTLYTVILKEGLTWHDGAPITAADVVFTVNTIKDPLIKSPKRPSWEGVTVTEIDDFTIQFALEQPYALFVENLATGIVPRHKWQGLASADFINNALNTEPVGSGPYVIKNVKRNNSGIAEYYDFVSFDDYALGEPYISNVRIRFYSDEKELISAYENGEINALGGVSPQWVIEQDDSIKEFPLTRIFGVFLNQSNAQIFTERSVRRALNLATPREQIVDEVLAGYGTPVNSPLPPGSLGYEETPPPEHDPQAARELLEGAGWEISPDGVFVKETDEEIKRLTFSLATANIPELTQTATILVNEWKKAGFDPRLDIFEIGDLNQEVIRPREYDALLFGEVTGRDPDPFAFWHSSQRLDPGLNIALYTNVTVDKLLSDARAESNRVVRADKYREFQNEIANDTPAVFIYSPHYLYLQSDRIKNNEVFPLTISSERFINIHTWFIETDTVWKFFNQS